MTTLLDHLMLQQKMAKPNRAATFTTAYLVSGPVNGRSTVSVYGSAPIAGVPTVADDYSGVKTVHVYMDERGRPKQVTGATSAPVADPEPDPSPPAGSSPSPTIESKSKVISPVFSGTWRTSPAGFGKWGGSTRGYPNHLAQASEPGSGSLLGIAVYGGQVKGLGAERITKMRLDLTNASTYQTFTPTIQGIANNTKPGSKPTPIGSTQTGPTLNPGKSASMWLDSGFLTTFNAGTIGGLALVGGSDGWVYGKGHGSSMTLGVYYEIED